MTDRTPLNRNPASYMSVEEGHLSRASSLITDAPKRAPLTSQWYLAYYIPALEWVRQYSLSSLPGDFFSGLTLASFQIPVTLSYATSLAGIDAIYGFYGLIIPPLVYALLGSVPVMVVAPEGPISLLLGRIVSPYFSDHGAHGHDHGRSHLDAEQVSSLIAGTAGALILFFGVVRLGFLTSILSQSLLRGFITGVGMVIITDQLPAMLGFSKEMHDDLGVDASSFAKMKYIWSHWRDAKFLESSISFYALVAILLFKILKRCLLDRGYKRAMLIPDILMIVIVSTIVSKWCHFEERGVGVVGDISVDSVKVIWTLRPKYFKDFKTNFTSSFYVGVLGLLESTVAARLLGSNSGLDEDTSLRSSNRELVALGTANIAGSLFGSLPSFGGYGRSKINMLSGGTTQMSAVVSSLVTLICTYKLVGLIYHLPRCTLSAIITSIGLSLLGEAPHEFKFFWSVRSYSDLATILLSLLATFFWSVEAGVTVGAATAVVRIIHHATRPRIQLLVRDPQTERFVNADAQASLGDMVNNDGVLIVKIPEPLTFANSTVLEDRLRRLELHGTTRVHPGQPRSREGKLETVVFHLKGVTLLDASAASTLCNIVGSYLARGVRVIFTEVVSDPDVRNMLEKSGIVRMLESQPWDVCFYSTVREAIHSLQTVSSI